MMNPQVPHTMIPDALPPLPTIAEEHELARRIEAGVFAHALLAGRASSVHAATPEQLMTLEADGREAQHQLVHAHTGLVWYVARPMARRTGLDCAELVQEGIVGLLEAVQRFDPQRGRFATCALIWIRAGVKDAAATALGGLGLPVKRAHAWWQVRAIGSRLQAELGRDATCDEIATESGRPRAQVAELLAWEPALALAEWAPAVMASGTLDGGLDSADALLNVLRPEERYLVARRFGLTGAAPASYAAIARHVGLSEATVRRRIQAALDVLRNRSETERAAA